MNFLDASPITFAHPWLLLLLLALPLVALFEGGKGAAPAVICSSLRPVMALGKPRRHRARTRVVRGEGESGVLEARVQLAEVGAADADAHVGIEELGRNEAVQLETPRDLAGGGRHHLRQAEGARRRESAGIEGALADYACRFAAPS